MATKTKFKVPELKEILAAINTYEGFCTECEEFTREMTEPDARDYDCPVCGEDKVIGAEELMLELL